MNPAPTARLAFLRLNISALECERPHQRRQDSRLPLQLSQRGIAFRNVGRKPRSEQKHQKDRVERAAPNLVSAGIFQTHLSSVAALNPTKIVQFSFTRASHILILIHILISEARKNAFKQASSCRTRKRKRKTIHFLASVLQWQVRTQGPCLQKELRLGWGAAN